MILSVSTLPSLEPQCISQGLAATAVIERYIWSASIKIIRGKFSMGLKECLSSGFCVL